MKAASTSTRHQAWEPWNSIFPGIFSLAQPMDSQRLQRNSASDRDAPAEPAAVPVPAPRNDDRTIETSIPSRLDALSWSGFHTRVVLALGITWILDGLE